MERQRCRRISWGILISFNFLPITRGLLRTLPLPPCLDARDLPSQQALDAYIKKGPCALTHAFDKDPNTRKMADDTFSDTFFEEFQDVELEVQLKRNSKIAKPRFYSGTLAGIVDGMMQKSTHEEAWYLLNEKLLEDAQNRKIKDPFRLPPSLFGKLDYFDLFPQRIRPKKHCLILGGTGARSFLHVDPFEWTGVNYLLEGRKIWTFFPPCSADLGLKRVLPEAWEGEVSAGWKSVDFDLYYKVPEILEGTVTLDLPEVLADVEGVQALVQEEGELVVIPPGWAHQVYHLQPGLSLAWQVCNRGNLKNVIMHMLTWAIESGGNLRHVQERPLQGGKAGLGQMEGTQEDVTRMVEILCQDTTEGVDERHQVMATIEKALRQAMILRHGPERGLQAYERLWQKQ